MRLGPEDGATALAEGALGGAGAGVTGALLTIELAGRLGDLAALFGLVCALAHGRLDGADIEPDNVVVRVDSEDGVVEFDLPAGLGAIARVNGEFHGSRCVMRDS